MAAGGVMPPPAGYWEGVERLCRANDILLVSDEVICGFGRLGTPFGCQKYGFTPDIMTLSKQITSSYMPLAAVMLSEAVYAPIADNSARLGVFGHGFTASGHPVATAVALENIAIIEERDPDGQRGAAGAAVPGGAAELCDHPLVGEVRGAGLIGALELVADKAAEAPVREGRPGRSDRGGDRPRGRADLPRDRRPAGALPADDRDRGRCRRDHDPHGPNAGTPHRRRPRRKGLL